MEREKKGRRKECCSCTDATPSIQVDLLCMGFLPFSTVALKAKGSGSSGVDGM